MGIRNDQDAQIIRNAVALECSKAGHCFLMYRGTKNIKNDKPYCRDNPDIPFLMSFGSGLFPGAVFDAESSPFQFMRDRQAYALLIPFEDLNNCPVNIPKTNAICQMYGWGEIYHGRSGLWKEAASLDTPLKGIVHFEKLYKGRVAHLQTALDKKTFLKQFQSYLDKAIALK